MAIASNAVISTVADSASSVAIIAATAAGRQRKGLIIHNNSTEILYIAFGATATTTAGGYTYKIPVDAHWEMIEPIFQGAINGIWAANASGAVSVTELV
jgi:hypothetical protein